MNNNNFNNYNGGVIQVAVDLSYNKNENKEKYAEFIKYILEIQKSENSPNGDKRIFGVHINLVKKSYSEKTHEFYHAYPEAAYKLKRELLDKGLAKKVFFDLIISKNFKYRR